MQNQNFWNDPYTASEYSGRHLIGDNDEFGNSYSLNPESQPEESLNELFTFSHSNTITSGSVSNMTSVLDSSTVSSSAGTEVVQDNKYDAIFSCSPSFIESPNSSHFINKHADEVHLKQNGLSLSQPVTDEIRSNDNSPSPLNSHKRRNSSPPNYSYFKRKKSDDSDIQSFCVTDVNEDSMSYNSWDVNKREIYEGTSWSDCYSPCRRRTTSVVSSDKGLGSLISVFLSEQERNSILAQKKKKKQKLDSVKSNPKQMDVTNCYKLFLEDISGPSQSTSEFDGDFTSKKDNLFNEADNQIVFENSTNDLSVNTESVEIDCSKNSQQIIFVADSLPVKDDVNVVSSSHCLTINTDSNVISLNNDALKNDMASKDSQEMILITDSIPKVNDADLISDTHNLAVDIDSKEGNLISINSNNVSERTIHENVLVPGSEIMFKAATYENDTNQNISSRTELDANSFFDHINIKDDPNCAVGNFTNDEISDSLDKIFTHVPESDDADVLYSIRQEHADDVAFDFDTDKLISLDTNISTETSGGTYVMSEGDVENFEILKSKLNNGDIVYNQSTSSEIYKEGVQNLTNKEDISSVLSGDLKSLPANCYLENKDDSHCNATYLEKQINLNMPRDACKINPEMRSEVSKAIKFHQEYLISQNSTNQITTNKVAINELDEIKMNICHENEGIFSPANDFSETCEIVFFNNEGLTNERDMNSQEDLKKQSDIFINNSDNSEKDIFLEKNVNSLPEGVEPQKNSYMIIMSNERQENEMFYNKIYENISDKETYKNETNLKDAVMSSSIRNSELKDEIIVVDEKHLITSDESVNIESSNLENKINDTSKIESLNTFTNKKSSKARKSLISKSSNSQVNNKVPIAVENIFNDLVSIESDNNSLIMQEQKSSAPNSFNSIISDIEIEKLHIQRHSAHLESSLVSPDSKIESSCHSKLPITLSFNNENKKRTAKKSFARNCVESSDDSSSDSDKLKNKVLSYSTKKFVDKSPKNAAKSFQYLNNNRINGDYQNTPLINNFSKSSDSVNEQRPTALKTFKKPFTVAKKSIAKETAYKTVIESYFKIRTAKKTYNKLHRSIQSTSVIELSADESSDEEVKNSPVCWSPAKDLKLSKTICLCSSKELLCLCNGQRLRLICEAEDSIDDEIVPCTKAVSQHHLLTPSSNLKHKIFCDIHLWRLKNHHCCPKCGYFCTQGTFLCCKYDQAMKETNENHLFHPRCLLVPDSCFPPGCPHCCMFSDFKNVHLSYVFGNENSQIANGNSDEQSEVNITDKFQNYHIFMTTQDDKSVNPIKVDCSSVPQLQDLKVMLMEITKEATLRLRPAGKCLFNPIKAGDIKKVLQFIANGVNPNHKFNTHKNNTPLHIAAYYGFTSIVHALLMYGASIDAINDDLETPLILAVEKNQLEVVQYLIHAGAQVDVKNENGLTAFHVACKNNYKEIAELLYKTGKFDVNIQDDGGWTPLVWACEKNCVDVVQWLVNLGADPNVRDNEENTALHWAACSGSCKILEIILNNGCYINFVNQRGDSALHIAARKDNFTCVQLLLKRNALLDCINKEGEAPIMCCDDDSVSWEILNNHLLNSAKLENISQQQHVVSRDISRGKENYPIQAVNEVDKEEFIMDFRYVTRNCFAPNLTVTRTVDSMELCYCKDNCSSSDCTCTRLSRCWYNLDGLLISDFDLYDPPSIYECNKTCHCPKSCINRVVQKGLRIPLQLFRTLNRGWGVRTLKFLTKGTFVCEYVGEVISENEISRRPDDTYFFDLDSSSGDYCVDGRFFGNIARFINHSCEPNLVSIRVFVEHQDLNFPRIAFFTMRDIEAFEELCFDYGIEFWVAKSRHFLCTCNSSLCKYSKDSIDSTLVEYIQEKDKQTEGSMDT